MSLIKRLIIVREKGESQNRGIKKTKHAKFPKNEHFKPPATQPYVFVSGSKKSTFFRKSDVPYFLFMSVVRFALLPYYLLLILYLFSVKILKIYNYIVKK